MAPTELPRALLVDLDDTIIDDTGNADRGWHEVCAEVAPRLGVGPELLATRVLAVRDWYWSAPERHRVGRMDLRAASAFIVELVLRELALDTSLARPMAEAYRDRRDAAQALLPGARETLATLRTEGVALALLTNGATGPQQRKIDRFDLASYFDCILIEEAFGVGKPDPQVYQHALSVLGCVPAAAWMIGDNLEWDVAAPQRLGLQGIWIDAKRRGLPANAPTQPSRIVNALRELL